MHEHNESKEPENILVICAHPDDEIFGVGGTVAKYAKEGKNVSCLIFSYGEMSHPWIKRVVQITTRVKESKEAGEYVGFRDTFFIGLKEGNFPEQFKRKRIGSRLRRIILEKKPTKIFTHGSDDPLPDHRAVLELVLNVLDRVKYKCDVYSFDIWNFALRKNMAPRLVIDISGTFKTKVNALKIFKSQWVSLLSLMPMVYIRAIYNGLNIGTRYAEVFYKVR